MRSPLLFFLALSAALAAAPAPADACDNVVRRAVDPAVQSIRRAEAMLADGRHQAAAREVLATFPNALRASHRERRQDLFHRGQRILALAAVRTGGALGLGPGLPGKTDTQRATNLAWAAAILRLHHARSGDVLVRTELAEALARRPAERAEAHALLKDLGDGDILPTARAWALLAALEHEFGDPAAAARATRRCREIAADAALCDAGVHDA